MRGRVEKPRYHKVCTTCGTAVTLDTPDCPDCSSTGFMRKRTSGVKAPSKVLLTGAQRAVRIYLLLQGLLCLVAALVLFTSRFEHAEFFAILNLVLGLACLGGYKAAKKHPRLTSQVTFFLVAVVWGTNLLVTPKTAIYSAAIGIPVLLLSYKGGFSERPVER